jgi:hypothetical protein
MIQKTILLLLVLLTSLPASGDPLPKDGDKAQNLALFPPWTTRLCKVGHKLSFHATYLQKGALKLKQLDNDCAFWKTGFANLKVQNASHLRVLALYKKVIDNFEGAQKRDAKRILDLESQLKKEIAEKNKYKYKPDYSWIGWVVGGGVALVAVGVLVGTWATPSD